MRIRQSFPKNRRYLLGFSLIEALIAFLIISVGLLGVAKLQTAVVGAASSSEQRNQALYLAQEKMECFRARPSTCAANYGAINTGSDASLTRGGATFNRSWTVVVNNANPAYKVLRVTVTWDNKEGTGSDDPKRRVVLESKIADI